MKKKTLRILFLLGLVLTLTSCGKKEAKDVVNIYNAGEYIDKDLLAKFEKETGIKVIYDTFVNNEDLYVKMKKAGSQFDLVMPSDYMIEKMIKEDMLDKIDFSHIDNYKYIDDIYKGLDYDPANEYSIPYFWGTVGILYNTDLVDEEIDSWDVLWDEKYKNEIIMLDSSRDSIGISLIRLGYSSNSKNDRELEEAKEALSNQFPLVYAYLVDETKDIMVNGDAKLAVMYSGSAVEAMDENESLDYIVPKEGSNLWFDSMVIPKNAKNKENAEKFINFILEPENAAQNAEYVGYSLPSSEAAALLDEEVREDYVAYPSKEVIENLEVFRDPGDYVEVYDQIWQYVKNN